MDEQKIKEVKEAFRVAYDFIVAHGHPRYDVDYFMGLIEEIKELRAAHTDNMLLECLSVAVYEYLAKVAKEESEK